LDSDPLSLLSLLLAGLFVFLNGFFVVSQHVSANLTLSKVDQLINQGDKRASFVKEVTSNLGTYLITCQIGVTIATLGLGMVIVPISDFILGTIRMETGLSSVLYYILYLALVTSFVLLHVIVGVQIPKYHASKNIEKTSLWTLPILYFFHIATSWVVNTTKFLIEAILGLLSIKIDTSHGKHTADEIKLIVSNSSEFHPEEQQMFNKVFSFRKKTVREVLVHRKSMETIFKNTMLEDIIRFIYSSNYSRFPVCLENKDDIIGYINAKDIFRYMYNNIGYKEMDFQIEDFIREMPRIYEALPMSKALAILQKGKHQIAIVVDEYGGVAGLITIEDILEEIVGEIQDEFDRETEPFKIIGDKVLVDASTSIDTVNEELKLNIEKIEGIDTIGGYCMSRVESPPSAGQKVLIDGYEIEISRTDNRRIVLLEFSKLP
jgi:CBS domain containing-hemolysin-like protein